MSEPGTVSRWWKKLAGGAQQAPRQADSATPICECRERSVVEVTGELTRVDEHHDENRHWLQAELSDGSGAVQLIWMGRGQIPGITLQRRLRVSGRLARVEERPTLFNPRYELLA